MLRFDLGSILAILQIFWPCSERWSWSTCHILWWFYPLGRWPKYGPIFQSPKWLRKSFEKLQMIVRCWKKKKKKHVYGYLAIILEIFLKSHFCCFTYDPHILGPPGARGKLRILLDCPGSWRKWGMQISRLAMWVKQCHSTNSPPSWQMVKKYHHLKNMVMTGSWFIIVLPTLLANNNWEWLIMLGKNQT